jgi:CheY-like chemotaxis protein
MLANIPIMHVDPEVLKAIAAIIAAVIWPLIAAGVILALFPGIKSIIKSRGFQVKFGSVEVSVQEATDKFQRQLNDLNEELGALRAALPQAIAQPALAASPPAPATRSGSILWVDDKPDGNALETAQLTDRSIDVVSAVSTGEAMRRLSGGATFDAVVSDMGRTEDGRYRGQAGLELLKAMRDDKIELPFLIYTGRRSAVANDALVKAAGGDGATASTAQLFEWINRCLGG